MKNKKFVKSLQGWIGYTFYLEQTTMPAKFTFLQTGTANINYWKEHSRSMHKQTPIVVSN